MVDLCCGTGAVGAALAARLAGAEVWAADVDPDAVACARRNLPPDRVREGDLYAALPDDLRGRVDVLAVNAPYVPTDEVAQMPPRGARPRAPGRAGRGRRRARRATAGGRGRARGCRPAGLLLVETSRGQADRTLALFAAAGLETRVETDDELSATVVMGRAGSGPV